MSFLPPSDGTPTLTKELPGTYRFKSGHYAGTWKVKIWRTGDPPLENYGGLVKDGYHVLISQGDGPFPTGYIQTLSQLSFINSVEKIED